MKRVTGMASVQCVMLLLLAAFGIQSPVWAESGTPKAVLGNDDCIKCHAKPTADIAASGMAHKTSVGCQDCHVGHPPTVKKIIPQCSQCHSGKSHYTLRNCLSCHTNPHTPKIITLGANITDPCLTCHSEQIKQLRDNPSKHSRLFCSTCHNVHGRIPPCVQCHKPHSKDMTQTDCKKCHKAHMPKNVAYKDDTPSKDCAACHKKAFDLLNASTFKHKSLSCVTCHQAKHKMVPQCQSCHGTPHPASMMSKFPKCGDCHNIAHDLNRWATATKLPATSGKKGARKGKR